MAGRSFKRRVLLAAAASVLFAANGASAQTVSCAEEPVSARGEPARFDWAARTKARANWRRKVRSIPGLGNAYATWTLAANAEEVCMSGPAGTACTFTGIPCRK